MAIDSIVINPNTTTLKDAVDFLQDKAGDGKILAKKNEDGDTILYVKADTAKSDKRQLRFYNGKLMSKASKKEAKAKDAISNLIANFTQEKSNQLGMGAGQLFKNASGMRAMQQIFTTIDSNLLSAGNAVSPGSLTQAVQKLEVLTEHLGAIKAKASKFTPSAPLPVPETSNRTLDTHTLVDGKSYADMDIDGKTYKAVTVLGRGGNGDVVKYSSPDGPDLAVKLPIVGMVDPEEKVQDAIVEYNNTIALAKGNSNLLGFDKLIPLPSGALALAGKIAPHGDLSQMKDKLASITVAAGEEPGPGQITQAERKAIALTMIRDAAIGLHKMHTEAKHIHVDVKAQNIMLGEHGQAVLIDLGESSSGDQLSPVLHKTPAAAMYLAPELAAAQSKAVDLRNEYVATQTKAIKDEVKQFVLAQGKTEADFDEMTGSVKTLVAGMKSSVRAAAKENTTKVTVDSKIDIWGLGTVAFELLTGRSVGDEMIVNIDKREVAPEAKALETWSKKETQAVGPGGLLETGSSDPVTDLFLNSILVRDPEKRPSAVGVINNFAMRAGGVGSDAARDLIKAIAIGDPVQITEARAALGFQMR